MRWSFRIGSLFGIRIELHVTFLLFIAWIAFTRGLLEGKTGEALESVLLLLLIFTCVVLHELGHALTARRFGIRTRDIILLPIGGLARLERMPDKPQQELLVAVAGPAVNVVIATLLLVVMGGVPHPFLSRLENGGIVETMFYVNVLMIVFNLVPAFPMDGGRVLRALLAFWLPYARATNIASAIGQAFALLFGTVGYYLSKNPMLIFIGLFVCLGASEERALVQRRSTLSGLPVRAAMVTDFHSLDAQDHLQRAVDYLMSGAQQDFPVLENGAPVGILTRSDLVRALQQQGTVAAVGDVIRRDHEYADAGEPLEDAVQRMRERSRSALPVIHRGGLVGMLTLENVSDLLVVRDALRRFSGTPRA
jgi:Zn-dependent protease/predicted transcriptional regulator